MSLSRIHRLLRPLRARTVALAECLNQPTARHTAALKQKASRSYLETPPRRPIPESPSPSPQGRKSRRKPPIQRASSTSTSNTHTSSRALGPLSALPSPNRLPKSSQVAHATLYGVPLVQLSRRVIAVRDAFRIMLQAVYPAKSMTHIPGISSLSELCASVVGASIMDTVTSLRGQGSDVDDDDFEEEIEEEEESALIDQCYELVPEHLRRWSVVPHAIDMIASLLPIPVPSLWEQLLDACIQSGTPGDISRALYRCLYVSVLSDWGSNHPLNSQLHENYFVNMLSKAPPTPHGNPRPWSEAHFVDAIIRVIHTADGRTDHLWSLRAMDKLFCALHDKHQQLRLFENLMTSIVTNEDTARSTRRAHDWYSSIVHLDIEIRMDKVHDPDEAIRWIDALQLTTLSLLRLSPPRFAPITTLVLNLVTHMLTRTPPSSFATVEDLVRAIPLPLHDTSCPPSSSTSELISYNALLRTLPHMTFPNHILRYTQALSLQPSLLSLELIFLGDVLSFAEAHNEPTDDDPDPEPLLDDDDLDALHERLGEVKKELARQKKQAAMEASRVSEKTTAGQKEGTSSTAQVPDLARAGSKRNRTPQKPMPRLIPFVEIVRPARRPILPIPSTTMRSPSSLRAVKRSKVLVDSALEVRSRPTSLMTDRSSSIASSSSRSTTVLSSSSSYVTTATSIKTSRSASLRSTKPSAFASRTASRSNSFRRSLSSNSGWPSPPPSIPQSPSPPPRQNHMQRRKQIITSDEDEDSSSQASEPELIGITSDSSSDEDNSSVPVQRARIRSRPIMVLKGQMRASSGEDTDEESPDELDFFAPSRSNSCRK